MRPLLLSILLTAPLLADVSGWLNWRGPLHTGASLESGLPEKCEPGKELWTYDIHGAGTPVIADGKLYAFGFYGEVGDLQELLGNLLENAFKWGKQRVLLTVKVDPADGNRREGVFLVVEDDGPGIDPANAENLLQRGVRGDERVQGHGIGLAIAQDIVRAYSGQLQVERSTELGGARFTVHFPPVV